MPRKEMLLKRLNEIGKTLEKKSEALVLLGLGSVGMETDRIDDYSDLDFFVIVSPGRKQRFIDHLDWLEDTHPLIYYFKNTVDGYKIMFEDGIYGELAIFEESELEHVSYSKGRIIWKASFYENDGIANPITSLSNVKSESIDFAINEALTNLYVGLGRYARGEKLSAVRFVENYAIDRIISVLHVLEPEVDFYPDKFGNERRLEKRFPQFANRISKMMQGYDKVPESAIHILNYMKEIYPINEKLESEIRRLAKQCHL